MGKIKGWYNKNKAKIIAFLKKWLMFFINPHFVICFIIGWFITNGWSYIFFTVGTYFDITWMAVVGAAYMSMLWAPFTPEKIITLFIAVFLLKVLFPKDEKTLKVLRNEIDEAKAALKRSKDKRKQKKLDKKIKKKEIVD